jgi:hypothetical protein
MEYAVEMASGSMIYIPNFMTIGLGIQVYNLKGYSVRRHL